MTKEKKMKKKMMMMMMMKKKNFPFSGPIFRQLNAHNTALMLSLKNTLHIHSLQFGFTLPSRFIVDDASA